MLPSGNAEEAGSWCVDGRPCSVACSPSQRSRPEALAPVVAGVLPGRPAEAEFRVRWRSCVEITGMPQDHQGPAPTLRVERLDPETGIRGALPSPRPSIRNSRPPQFAGWLAAGSYWLTFTGAQGQVHRETLQIADRAVRQTIPLPW